MSYGITEIDTEIQYFVDPGGVMVNRESHQGQSPGQAVGARRSSSTALSGTFLPVTPPRNANITEKKISILLSQPVSKKRIVKGQREEHDFGFGFWHGLWYGIRKDQILSQPIAVRRPPQLESYESPDEKHWQSVT
jgi:hypothetical protein